MCSDPQHPRLAGRVFVGGSIRKGGAVKVSTAPTLIHVCKTLAPPGYLCCSHMVCNLGVCCPLAQPLVILQLS